MGVVLVANGPVQRRAHIDTVSKYGVYRKVEFSGQLRDHQLLKKKTVSWIVAKRKEMYVHATRTQYGKTQLLAHRKHPASRPRTPNSMVWRETMDIRAENRT